jgi:hypothetical protein
MVHGSPFAIFRIVLRRILPDLVLGSREIDRMIFGVAIDPIRLRTADVAKAEISADFAEAPSETTKSTSGTSPLMPSATPTTAHSAILRG